MGELAPALRCDVHRASRRLYDALPMRPRRLNPLLPMLALLLATPAAHAAAGDAGEHPGWEKSGDLLQWGIPAGGLLLSFLLRGRGDADGADTLLLDDAAAPGLNWPGPRLGHSAQRDFLVAFVRMEATTYALKYAINAKRPNGGGQSFPSGHTAAAFMGAEFIRKHYGDYWGAPAYVAASWVGYTRVESHNHYWRDVIAGAALGIASNYDFDDVDTPLGQLSFGVDSFTPGPYASGFDDSSSDPAARRELPVFIGLHLQLRF